MDEGMNFIGDAPRAWGENESEVFVGFGRAMVPSREEIERTLLELLPAGRDEPFVGVEIGTGAGWLSAAVLREFSGARMIGLDGSPEMLRKTGELLAPYGERAELRLFRLEEPSWKEELPTVRVFLSSLVLHHLDGSGKRELFTRLFSCLELGGALLFADVMEPRTERARRHSAAAWREEIRRRSLRSTATRAPTSSSSARGGTSTTTRIRWTGPPHCPSSYAGWRKLGLKELTCSGHGLAMRCSAATSPPTDCSRIHQNWGEPVLVQS